jgi:cell division septation protein DedD
LSSVPGESEDITAELPSGQFGTPNLSGPEPLLQDRRTAAKGSKTVTVTQLPPSAPAQVTSPATKPAPSAVKPAPTAPEPAATPETAAGETQVAALSAGAEMPARAGGGSVMIQLGSFPNDKLAASAWSKIKSANQELLGDYSPMIRPAEIEGKGTWYRLRLGGFADKAAAASVCEQLKATGQACIIASK